MFQVLQQESSPHFYLTVTSGKTNWSIKDTVEAGDGKIQSASAGTACPASPSNSVDKSLGQNSWQYDNSPWLNGNIIVSCETPNRCL